MDQSVWEKQLADDGFSELYVHTDEPHFEYAEHDHPVDTAHVILAGGMSICFGDQEHRLMVGDRFDVPKSVPHTAKMGPDGCTYLIGIKI